jgi:hypothetical protein
VTLVDVFIFSQKLKALKNDLKRWNEHEFGNVEFHKKKGLWKNCVLLICCRNNMV